jgi:hypothetical protein
MDMSTRKIILRTFVCMCAIAAMPSLAQTTAGAGTIVVLPTVASIPGAYTTTVFVRNPNTSSITLDVRYYQSDSATPPGDGTPVVCTPLTIGANLAVTFDLAVQCNFAVSDNFGQLVLTDATGTFKTNTFYAYSRSQKSNGNGFSVEGFPVGNFSGSSSEVLGLKSTPIPSAPHYRSNCFVGALGEPVDYQILLVQGETGAVLGSVSGSIGAFHTVRILDVFAMAGIGATQNNVRATFSNTAGNGASYIGFCTLETTDTGSADFRIAKSSRANDERQSRLICYAMDNCTDTHASINNPAQLSAGKRNIHWAIFDQPDFVKCDLVSDQLSALQIQLRGPTDSVQGVTPFVLPAGYNSAPYTAGGSGTTSFYIYTGEKSTINSGVTTRWFIDVTASGGGSPVFPINYGIKCSSGNGITVPWLARSV